MGTILKGFQSVLIALGIIAVIGTGIIIYYNAVKPQDEDMAVAEQTGTDMEPEEAALSAEETEETEETDVSDVSEGEDGYISGDTADSVFSAENGHEHTYTSTVLRPATCTEAGEIRYTCYCGDFYVDAIPPLDHTPGSWVTVRTATASQTGLRQRSCTICGRTLEEETIPMLAPVETVSTVSTDTNNNKDTTDNHKHSYTYEITEEASCTEKGEKTYTCATCGSTFKTNIPATNHPSRKTVRTEGDCANPGKIETICNLCEAVISSETLYYEHNWSSWTTDSSGVKTRTCKKCGETQTKNGSSSSNNNNNNNNSSNNNSSNNNSSNNNSGNNSTNNNNSNTTPGANHTHTYTSSITTPATCESPGVTTYTCTAGDDTYTEDKPEALGHRWGTWVTTKPATAEEEGERTRTCSNCGQTETMVIAKLPEVHQHTMDAGKITRQATCTREGVKRFTCTSCGYYYTTTVPKIQHSDRDGDGRCDVCNTPMP